MNPILTSYSRMVPRIVCIWAILTLTVWTVNAQDYIGPEIKELRNFNVSDASTTEALDHAQRCSDLGLFTEETQVLEALKYTRHDMTPAERARCLYHLALSYYSTGSYQLSLKNLFDLLRMDKPDSLRYYDVSGKIILAGTYMRFHSNAQADSVLKLVDRDLQRYRFKPEMTRKLRHDYYLEKSTVHADRKEWPQYIQMLKESDKYCDDNADNALRRKLDYGIYYMQTKRPDLAEQYFKSISLDPEWSYNKMAAMANYAEMLYNEKRYEDAIKIADEVMEMIKGHRMDQMKSTIFLVKGLSLYELGEAREGVPYLEESRILRDSIFDWHTTHSVLGSARDFERDLDSSDMEEIRKANTRSRIVITLLCIAILGLAFMSMLIYNRLKIAREEKRKLGKQLDEIEQVHHAQISDTLDDLSENKRRIVSLTLKLAQVNDVVRKALDRNSTEDPAQRISELQEGMKHVDMNRNVWETFNLLFEQTNPDFYRNLCNRHPDLTKGEKRMCAYIKLELSTKEIATVTNRSARTVETVKYRLRKKFDIPEGVSLESYIAEL